LFVCSTVSIEPLLEKIRGDQDIKGPSVPGIGDRKLMAYADDTVFFPPKNSSIKNILNTFAYFNHFSSKEGVK
jgi:hypothetical protein